MTLIIYALVEHAAEPALRREFALVSGYQNALEIQEIEIERRFAEWEKKDEPIGIWEAELAAENVVRVESRPVYSNAREYLDARESSDTPVKGAGGASLEGFDRRPCYCNRPLREGELAVCPRHSIDLDSGTRPLPSSMRPK